MKSVSAAVLACVGLFAACGGGGGGVTNNDGGVVGTGGGAGGGQDGPPGDTADGQAGSGGGPGGAAGVGSGASGGTDPGSTGGAGGAGGSSSCPAVAVCIPDALRCQGGAPQKCVADASGCPRWEGLPACGTHQVCASGVCSCAVEPRCGTTPTEGDFCPVAGGATFGHCAKDGDNCIFVSAASNACATAQTCNAGAVVDTGLACGCPADGATLGTGCSNRTIGNTTGDVANGAILSCEMVGSCRVWKTQVNCAATGLTVGVLSGVPVCVCQPASAGTYYVDPAPGASSLMNGNATGTNLPPACRLRSIKDALAHIAAAPTFTRVVVAHEPSLSAPAPIHLGAASGETFPLTIPPGITVTTADGAALNPAHYVIDVSAVAGSVHFAVRLGDKAVLSGFTVDTSGGVGTANAATGVENVVTCTAPETAQAATLDQVTLAAKGNQTGLLISGACALTANDVHVTGAWVGADVARTATSDSAEATLTSRGLNVTSMVSGSIGVRVGSGLDGGARSSAALTTPSLAAGIGLSVLGGSATVDGGTIVGGNPPFEETVGGQISGGGALTLSGVTLTGGQFFTGLQLSGTSHVTLQANAGGPTKVTTSLAADATDPSDGVVMTEGATLTIAGGTEISHFDAGLVINDGSLSVQGTNVAVKENRGNGVELLGRTAGATIALSSGTVRDNGGKGIVVRTTVPSTLQNLIISGNHQDGVDFQRTQGAAQSGYRLVFAGNTVSANSGRGIALTGKGVGAGALLLGGKVGVRLERNNVNGNGGVGIYVSEAVDAPDGDDVTEVTMDSNDVGGNFTASASAPSTLLAGGLFFARSDASTRILLGSFLGNRVHGNGRHEIAFDLSQDSGAAWNLSSNASAVDMATACADAAKPNSVYCYDTVMGQDLGIALSANTIHVNVQGMHFQNAIPVAGHDYSLGIPSSEITLPCAAQICQ